MNIFFSIIIPVYNAEGKLPACIESVLKQDYQKKELIIIDGNSTDSSLIEIERYSKNNDILRYISESDNGIYDAMNKGISLAKGNYLYFLGSDDELYSPTVLSNIASNIDGADLIYGNVELLSDKRIFNGIYSLEKLMYKNICHQSIFYNRNLFDDFGKYNLKYSAMADYLFNIICITSKAKIKYQDIIIARYNDNGFSNSGDDNFRKDKTSILKKYFANKVSKEQLRLAINNTKKNNVLNILVRGNVILGIVHFLILEFQIYDYTFLKDAIFLLKKRFSKKNSNG